tara:strand:- start:4884 stop:6146 length:1263 start_codon:yes stop_codon:yes gene_type:complete
MFPKQLTNKFSLKKIFKLIKAIPIMRKKFPKRIDIILFCHDNDRSMIKKGKKYSHLIDGIQDQLIKAKFKCITLAPIGSKYISEAYGNVYPIFVFWDFFNIRQLYRFFKIGKKSLHFPVNIENFIYKKQPKLIAGVEPISQLIKFCRQQNIPIIDVWHGYGISKNHHIYGQNALKEKSQDEVCTDLILLDNLSKNILKKNCLHANRFISLWSLLSPVLSKKTLTYRKFNYLKKYKKIFLISLQFGHSPGCLPEDGNIHKRIINTIIQCKAMNFAFLIKPHPAMLEKELLIKNINDFCISHTNCFYTPNDDLIDLINLADGHLTSSSGVTRECALKGVKTLLYSNDRYLFDGKDSHLEEEIKSGIAHRVNKLSISQIINLAVNLEVVDIKNFPSFFNNIYPDFISADKLFKKIINKSKKHL